MGLGVRGGLAAEIEGRTGRYDVLGGGIEARWKGLLVRPNLVCPNGCGVGDWGNGIMAAWADSKPESVNGSISFSREQLVEIRRYYFRGLSLSQTFVNHLLDLEVPGRCEQTYNR